MLKIVRRIGTIAAISAAIALLIVDNYFDRHPEQLAARKAEFPWVFNINPWIIAAIILGLLAIFIVPGLWKTQKRRSKSPKTRNKRRYKA